MPYKLAKYLLEPNDFSNKIEYSLYKASSPKSVKETQSNSKPMNTLEMTFENIKDINTSNPTIWGPPLWFTLHNTAIKYPVIASPLYSSNMKNFINSIPYILPCEKCKVHAINYIDTIKNELDYICNGRENLFKFFVDFHNSVNKRNNKKEISYEEAYKIYNSNVNVTRITYK